MEINVKDNLVEVTFKNVANTENEQIELASKYNKEMKKLFAKFPEKKFSILIVLSETNKITQDIPHSTIKIYDEISNSPHVNKLAILGDNKFAEIIVSIIFFRFKERKVNWFTDRQKALKWLGMVQ